VPRRWHLESHTGAIAMTAAEHEQVQVLLAAERRLLNRIADCHANGIPVPAELQARVLAWSTRLDEFRAELPQPS
jgi:hypothetical protein